MLMKRVADVKSGKAALVLHGALLVRFAHTGNANQPRGEVEIAFRIGRLRAYRYRGIIGEGRTAESADEGVITRIILVEEQAGDDGRDAEFLRGEIHFLSEILVRRLNGETHDLGRTCIAVCGHLNPGARVRGHGRQCTRVAELERCLEGNVPILHVEQRRKIDRGPVGLRGNRSQRPRRERRIPARGVAVQCRIQE